MTASQKDIQTKCQINSNKKICKKQKNSNRLIIPLMENAKDKYIHTKAHIYQVKTIYQKYHDNKNIKN